MQIIRTVAVVGAGTMGQGIAQVCALHGFKTMLFDVDPAQRVKAMDSISHQLDGAVSKGKLTIDQKTEALRLISVSRNIEEVKADLIIEAVVERLEIKQELFRLLEQNNSDETILASNTSSLSIDSIATVVRRPARFLGIHFFNPADRMKLVELIGGAHTQSAYLESARQFLTDLKKTVVNAKDSPGFIVNRVARPYYTEALHLLEQESAAIETIDQLMEASGFRMGPFRLMDLIGLDTNLAVTRSVYEGFGQHPRFRPSPIQQNLVERGMTGMKSGSGFYQYPAGKP